MTTTTSATQVAEEGSDKVHVETTQTHGESSTDEIEALKTAGKLDDEYYWRSSCPKFVHHQVLKIRQEESHLGEDIGEGLSAKDIKVSSSAFLPLRSHMDAIFYSRPSSPLGNKSVFRSLQ